jgi:UDPglucose 6-dehydrogenase
MRKIAVIGTGYVGLVTGTCLAQLGNEVICMDHDKEKIDLLNQGKCPIFEPKLPELIEENKKKARLSFTASLEEAVRESEIIFIAVGTPPQENGEADLSAIENVSAGIAQAMTEYKLIVEKSTVPIKTNQWVKRTIEINQEKNLDFDLASNPEFLREGSAVDDFMKPDRIVIGVESRRAEKILKELYAPLNVPIITTDINSAELIKHASNCFLALKISYINLISDLCEKTGAQIDLVTRGIGADKRIGQNGLKAGLGFGGFCFPKDLLAFIKIIQEANLSPAFFEETLRINKERRKKMVEKIKNALWILKGKKVGLLGLSFKPQTDDLREAPSVEIIQLLQKEGALVKVYDPAALEKAKKKLTGRKIAFCSSPYEAATEAHCLVICTEWPEFEKLNWSKIKNLMDRPVVVDGRGMLKSAEMKKLGFTYHRFG